ncbi:hypothetical protein ABTM34_20345 [Acinetobacter baumannii]
MSAMAPVTFAKRPKNFGRLDYSRRGARRRIRDAGPEQQAQAVAAWLAQHAVTRCPPGIAFGASSLDDGVYF